MTKQLQFQHDPARVDRQKAGGLFQYGPTKCALILRDMVTVLDQAGYDTSKHIGRAFAKLDEMLDLVTLRFLELHAKRRKNLLNEHDVFGFKEHLVQDVMINLGNRLASRVPETTRQMFLTVAKEKINIRKVQLGLAKPKAGINYTTRDLIEWAKTEPVLKARSKWFIETMKTRYDGAGYWN